jgi:hypothetical protein
MAPGSWPGSSRVQGEGAGLEMMVLFTSLFSLRDSYMYHPLCQKVPRLTQLQPGHCGLVGIRTSSSPDILVARRRRRRRAYLDRYRYVDSMRGPTLMLDVHHPDVGSTWRGGGGGAGCHLHVRKSWARQCEDNALTLCYHGNGNGAKDAGSHWASQPGPVPGSVLLRNSRSGG